MPENKPKQNVEVKLTIRNEVKLDPKNPIPIQYAGNSFSIVKGKKYIPFLGRKDNLPNLLLEARLTSTTQNACITSIAQSVIGKGLSFIDLEKPNPDLLKWMQTVNNKEQSFDEVLSHITDGERTHGNQFIEIVRGDFAGKKFIKIYLHSMLHCRLEEEDTSTGYPTAVLISRTFAKNGIVDINKAVRKLPLYSANELDQKKVWAKNPDGTESTTIHFKNDLSGIEHYGLPASISGLRYQVLEGKSAQYNIDNFENNMVLGGMLIFKSAMTQEEANRNAKEILLSHVGDGKTGRIAVLSSETGLDDVDWKPYDTQKEGSYIELDKRIEEKIVAANGWDTTLAGINRESSLGNGSSYIRSIFDVKESSLLKPLRKRLIDKVVIPIMKIYSEWHSVKEIAEYKYTIHSDMPFSFLGDLKPEDFMKVNEARELARLEPDEKNGEKYLSEVRAKNKTDVQGQPTSEEGTNNK